MVSQQACGVKQRTVAADDDDQVGIMNQAITLAPYEILARHLSRGLSVEQDRVTDPVEMPSNAADRIRDTKVGSLAYYSDRVKMLHRSAILRHSPPSYHVGLKRPILLPSPMRYCAWLSREARRHCKP